MCDPAIDLMVDNGPVFDDALLCIIPAHEAREQYSTGSRADDEGQSNT
jgi:hypothetical protein